VALPFVLTYSLRQTTGERNMANGKVLADLNVAIDRMRIACDDAERHAQTGDSRAIRQVLHDFAWAWANASGDVQNAMTHLEEEK
jgi:hypothetical protein